MTKALFMGMRSVFSGIGKTLQTEIRYYRLLHGHPETPWAARWCLWLALAYVAMPFDLIPDWLPVLGQLDDLVIVPLLLFIALKVVPAEIKRECRASSFR